MAGLKASVNPFAFLDRSDPGDKRLTDLDDAIAEETEAAAQAKPKPKPKPRKTAPGNGGKPKKAAAASKAKKPTPAASKAKNVTPGVGFSAENSTAAAESVSTDYYTPPQPAGPVSLTQVLFGGAYPSARDYIIRQNYLDKQAKANMQYNGVSGDGKSAGASADDHNKAQGGTKRGGYAKNEAPAPSVQAPPAPVLAPPPPPPSLYDTNEFPSLK